MDVAILGGVVQHGVEAKFIDLGHRADTARAGARHFLRLLALQQQQVRNLERLAALADIELAVARDRALVDAEHGELADIGIDHHLEHVRQHVLVGHRLGAYRLAFLGTVLGGAGGAVEQRRVAFGGVRQQPHEDVEQFFDAGAGGGRGKADRHQVALAQCALERGVQLLGRDGFALLQVDFHQCRVDFDDLVDQRFMRRCH
ncbi:hypothetical protein D9M70_387230 [compost metagenome]